MSRWFFSSRLYALLIETEFYNSNGKYSWERLMSTWSNSQPHFVQLMTSSPTFICYYYCCCCCWCAGARKWQKKERRRKIRSFFCIFLCFKLGTYIHFNRLTHPFCFVNATWTNEKNRMNLRVTNDQRRKGKRTNRRHRLLICSIIAIKSESSDFNHQ